QSAKVLIISMHLQTQIRRVHSKVSAYHNQRCTVAKGRTFQNAVHSHRYKYTNRSTTRVLTNKTTSSIGYSQSRRRRNSEKSNGNKSQREKKKIKRKRKKKKKEETDSLSLLKVWLLYRL
ncbi:hypothetical protein PanWU01x14_138670, partial [Parasponia andersonii]